MGLFAVQRADIVFVRTATAALYRITFNDGALQRGELETRVLEVARRLNFYRT